MNGNQHDVEDLLARLAGSEVPEPDARFIDELGSRLEYGVTEPVRFDAAGRHSGRRSGRGTRRMGAAWAAGLVAAATVGGVAAASQFRGGPTHEVVIPATEPSTTTAPAASTTITPPTPTDSGNRVPGGAPTTATAPTTQPAAPASSSRPDASSRASTSKASATTQPGSTSSTTSEGTAIPVTLPLSCVPSYDGNPHVTCTFAGSDAPGVSTLRLLRSVAGDPKGTVFAVTGTNNYRDDTAVAGVAYRYVVQGVNAAGAAVTQSPTVTIAWPAPPATTTTSSRV